MKYYKQDMVKFWLTQLSNPIYYEDDKKYIDSLMKDLNMIEQSLLCTAVDHAIIDNRNNMDGPQNAALKYIKNGNRPFNRMTPPEVIKAIKDKAESLLYDIKTASVSGLSDLLLLNNNDSSNEIYSGFYEYWSRVNLPSAIKDYEYIILPELEKVGSKKGYFARLHRQSHETAELQYLPPPVWFFEVLRNGIKSVEACNISGSLELKVYETISEFTEEKTKPLFSVDTRSYDSLWMMVD